MLIKINNILVKERCSQEKDDEIKPKDTKVEKVDKTSKSKDSDEKKKLVHHKNGLKMER